MDARIPDTSTAWQLWHSDRFDPDSSPSVQSRGENILRGLYELWLYTLAEGILDNGSASFSYFYLTWGDTVHTRADVHVQPFNNLSLVKLRQWAQLTTPEQDRTGTGMAVLQRLAQLHYELLRQSPRWNTGSISASAEARELLAQVDRMIGPQKLLGRDTGVIVRIADPDDLPAIVDIYNQSIPSNQSTGDTQPVRLEDRRAWFDEHRPEAHPILVAEVDGEVAGWCSLSAYRPGRAALRFTAEISYYIASAYQRRGLATALVEHALAACPRLGIRHVFAIVLEGNQASLHLLQKMGFTQWGYLPRVADFDGREVGHFYYGRHV